VSEKARILAKRLPGRHTQEKEELDVNFGEGEKKAILEKRESQETIHLSYSKSMFGGPYHEGGGGKMRQSDIWQREGLPPLAKNREEIVSSRSGKKKRPHRGAGVGLAKTLWGIARQALGPGLEG